MPQLDVVSDPSAGKNVPVHVLAAELNPDPLKVKTDPIVPELGETATLAVTLKATNGGLARMMSFAGVPLTCIVQFLSVVANGPTTKLPVATCELIEQVGEVDRSVLGITIEPTVTPDNTVQPVSVIAKPVPLNVTTPPFVWLVGNSTSVLVRFSVKVVNALSPLEPSTVIV